MKLCSLLEKPAASQLRAGRSRGWEAVPTPVSPEYLQSSLPCPRCRSSPTGTRFLAHHSLICHSDTGAELGKQKQLGLARRSSKLLLFGCLPSPTLKPQQAGGSSASSRQRWPHTAAPCPGRDVVFRALFVPLSAAGAPLGLPQTTLGPSLVLSVSTQHRLRSVLLNPVLIPPADED